MSKRRRSSACSRASLAWSRSGGCDAQNERWSKEKWFGIVWRDGNTKEIEVTLTQTEMAMVVTSMAGGEVAGDGEAEDLLPSASSALSVEWRMAMRLGGVDSEKRKARGHRHVVATRRLARSLPLCVLGRLRVRHRERASWRGCQVGQGRSALGGRERWVRFWVNTVLDEFLDYFLSPNFVAS